jgi:hypothetical protein
MGGLIKDDVLDQGRVGTDDFTVLDRDHTGFKRVGCIATPLTDWLVVTH